MTAPRHHSRLQIGSRVVVETRGGIIYGAAGLLTLTKVHAGFVTLSLPKGAPAICLPASSIKTIIAVLEPCERD